MDEPREEPVVWDREVAAFVAVVFAVVSVAVVALFPVLSIMLAVIALNAGGWAAARGERAALATVAILLGAAGAVAGVVTLLR